ncbi:hypothetical protein [Kitasatospora cheerisanensis]|uniref:Bacterial Ig-like domain-containing protein n=1 Tax=Kitasatospora cheerisanensis KCTC 2395 TaxID=1348663 RepID=A0A066Z423_9ACTN|nr:hypothetical protein [Kitasatospora cheerisanensis]KDN85091.1 hypothetical protein KCH_31900 [Kitasatospora cheerisanensis KCTC 2395]
MSRATSPRLLAACATAALAAGLFAAPAAQAVPGHAVTGPTVRSTPALTGDGCDATGTPGWLTTASPVLTAHTTAPSARFKVWDAAGAKVFDGTAATAADGTVQVTVPGLADGAGYTWQVWPDFRPGSGAPTETCRFGVDTAAPTALTVASADFPETGGGKYAGQKGVFTFSAADAASGVACFRYVLDNTPGVGGCAPGQGVVAAAADGTASVTLKPAEWGSHTLTVQAVDQAGNAAQPVSYTFYAPSNPNPPKALGDVDNDGVPDILLPDSQGNLLVIGGDAGSTAPTTVVPAAQAPIGGSWSGLQVVHKGWSGGGAPADTVYVRDAAPGNSGYLYQYVNQGALPLGTRSPSLIGHATSCVDTAKLAVACPADHSTGYQDVQQLVAFGSVETANPNGITLLDVEQGNLWLQRDPSRFGKSTQLTSTGLWNGYDLIAPGPDANGNLALWAREQSTGTLRSYAVPKLANGGFDFSALADPATGTVIGSFPVAGYPTLGSSGDLDGDGQADLYAVTADRHLVTFEGVANPKDLGALA